MREIKFRLRDRHNKIVGYEKWYPGQWHPDNPDEGFSLDSGYWEAQPCWLYSVDGKIWWTPTYISHRCKDVFIDRMDRYGREIYEEDVVTHPLCVKEPHSENEPCETFVGRIVYEADRGQYFAVNMQRNGHVITMGEAHELKIIGNKWANPELVKA